MEATTLSAAGYKVSVICPKGKYSKIYEVINGVSIYRYPLPSLNGIIGHLVEYGIAVPVTFLLSWIVLLREGFDVIQSANPPDFFFLIGGFFKLLGKRFVFDHHDLVPESCETRWTGMKLRFMRRVSLWAEWATFRMADRVIATNESYRAVALNRGRVSPDCITIVRSGPKMAEFNPVPPHPELKQGRQFMACYLGVMGPNDGLEHLLKAIRCVVYDMRISDVQFVLIGNGDLRPMLMEMSKMLGLNEYVRFTGRISDEAVIAFLSTADLCVAPDPKDPLNDLSTMNKIIEYMAIGKPIVAFDLHEARVSAAEAAVYATANDPSDFAKKIVELLFSPDKRNEMGSLGRIRFEKNLNWEHQSRSLLELYARLLGEPSEPEACIREIT
jgi:glycosyltransferase involved in cell wall biosynthesis